MQVGFGGEFPSVFPIVCRSCRQLKGRAQNAVTPQAAEDGNYKLLYSANPAYIILLRIVFFRWLSTAMPSAVLFHQLPKQVLFPLFSSVEHAHVLRATCLSVILKYAEEAPSLGKSDSASPYFFKVSFSACLWPLANQDFTAFCVCSAGSGPQCMPPRKPFYHRSTNIGCLPSGRSLLSHDLEVYIYIYNPKTAVVGG